MVEHMIRKALVSACILGLAAAPLEAQRTSSPEADVNVSLRGFANRILLDTLVLWKTIPRTPAQTFSAARRVLDFLKIPITEADSLGGVIFNKGFIARSRLAGQRISSSLRCGHGLAGDYADFWRVSIAYAVYVQPSGDKSRLGIALVGAATDVEGVSKPAVHCATTGVLEGEIARMVNQAVYQ